jgi:hypothetical protein
MAWSTPLCQLVGGSDRQKRQKSDEQKLGNLGEYSNPFAVELH